MQDNQERFEIVPKPLTNLIGRDRQVKDACALILNKDVRLLTLTGAGGVGKTRLALAVADEVLDQFEHGVCFLALDTISNPDLVLSTISHALKLTNKVKSSQLSYLCDFIGDKDLLLILDNFEHILPAASILPTLLSACRNLKILVTSRTVLRLQGEYQYPVPLLEVPNLLQLDQASEYSSIILFTKRAQAMQSTFQISETNFQLVAKICAQLDGLPLAIELAAAWVKILPLDAILEQLNHHKLQLLSNSPINVPQRQQTLRKTLTWSYNLLSLEEQRFWRRISVFAGNLSLNCATAFCDTFDDISSSALDLISALLDKNLVQLVVDDEPRISMLGTLREFAFECLEDCGEIALATESHIRYYLNLAEEAEKKLIGLEQEKWLNLLDLEHNNIRASLEYSLQSHQYVIALRTVSALLHFWFLRGYVGEGRKELLFILKNEHLSNQILSIEIKAKALYVVGWLAYWDSDFEGVIDQLYESLELFRQLNQKKQIADVLNLLGIILQNQNKIDQATKLHDECLKLRYEIGDQTDIAGVLLTLGIIDLFNGDFEAAQKKCTESLSYYKELKDPWKMAMNLHFLGWAKHAAGDYESAKLLSEESVAVFKKLGNPGFVTEALTILAYEMIALDDTTNANFILLEALEIGQRIQNPEHIARTLCGLGYLNLQKNNFDCARKFYEESLVQLDGLARTSRIKWVIASCLEGIGQIYLLEKQPIKTICLFAAADSIRISDSRKNPIGIDAKTYQQTLTGARGLLGDAIYFKAWNAGRVLEPLQALTAEITYQKQSKKQLPRKNNPTDLTKREYEVLHLIGSGFTNDQMAEKLVVSTYTINAHIQSIYSKLGVKSRVQALRYAIDHQLISLQYS